MNRGAYNTTAAIGPLAVLTFDNIWRTGEDVGPTFGWDGNTQAQRSTLSFVTGSMQSQPSQALINPEQNV